MFFKPTDTHQLLHWKSSHPHHTFKGIVKSQIIRFHRNSSNKQNVNEAGSVLFRALKPSEYSTRFLWKNKSETVREIENPLVSTEPYKIKHNLPPRIGIGYSITCNKTRCRLHSIINLFLTPNSRSAFRAGVSLNIHSFIHSIIKTQSTFKCQQAKIKYQIRTDLNCDSVNVV